MVKNKLFTFLLLGLLLINLSSALDCWAGFDRDTDIELLQICPTCSYVNITSISYPNGTIFLNEEMEKQGYNFNYSLPDNSPQGIITYVTIGDKNGANPPKEETLCIKIGANIETSESLVYFILAFGVFSLFALSFYFMIATPYGNKVDEEGAVIKLTKLKYVKLALILLSWVLLTWFLNILIGLSDNFVKLTMYYGFFGFMFDLMNRLALWVGLIVLVIAFFEIIRDANLQKNIELFGSVMK